MPPKMMGEGMDQGMDAGMDESMEGGGETVLPVASYPDLEAAEEGQKVMLMGTVKANDGENVTIGYDSVELQQNMADQALGKMTGVKKAAPAAPAQDDGEGEGY